MELFVICYHMVGLSLHLFINPSTKNDLMLECEVR